MKIGISIPTYNEVSNISKLLTAIKEELSNIHNLNTIVVVVDDNSPDGTGEAVLKASKKLDSNKFKVLLLSRSSKDGFGRACVAGFKKLLKQDVQFVIQMDADMSHDPAYLPVFVKASKNHDFVVASRYIKGGDTPDWSLTRRILSRYGNLYARTILSRSISDYTGGFNMYSSTLLNNINLDTLHATGYGFLIELKFRAIQLSDSLYQIPIIFKDRQHGKSKIPKSTLIKNLVLVPRIKIVSIKSNRKYRY